MQMQIVTAFFEATSERALLKMNEGVCGVSILDLYFLMKRHRYILRFYIFMPMGVTS